jgi:hypothetical protein
MAKYALDNAWDRARRRLTLLEQRLDPITQRRLLLSLRWSHARPDRQKASVRAHSNPISQGFRRLSVSSVNRCQQFSRYTRIT